MIEELLSNNVTVRPRRVDGCANARHMLFEGDIFFDIFDIFDSLSELNTENWR